MARKSRKKTTRRRRSPAKKTNSPRRRASRDSFQDKLLRVGAAQFALEIAGGLVKKIKPYVGLDMIPERYLIPMVVMALHKFGVVKLRDLDTVAMASAFNALFREFGIDYVAGGGLLPANQMHRTPQQTAAAIQAAQRRNFSGRMTPARAKQYSGASPQRSLPVGAMAYRRGGGT